MTTYYGVYRVLAGGALRYVPRSATTNEKLAKEIAADLTEGVVTMPDGSRRTVRTTHARRYIAKEI